MLLLPFDKTTYATLLSMEEVKARLTEAINDEDEKRNKKKDYRGKVLADTFYLYHYMAYYRQGLPYISILNGKLKTEGDKVLIAISSRMIMIVLVFFIIFLAIFTYPLITDSRMTVNGKEVTEYIWLYKLGIFTFIYLFFLVPYKISYYRNRQFLMRLLKAKVLK